ncbi:MAG: hypothetical protein J7K85_07775 [Anaerolineaceae bacterium]|nr:hypothetical protein [Anaerolineaceae bacterium]
MNNTADFVIGIQFTRLGKIYHFKANKDRDLKTNDVVLVETTRGLQLGRVVEFPKSDSNPRLQRVKSIIRKADSVDLLDQKSWTEIEAETTNRARKCLKANNVKNIKVVDSEYGYQGNNLTFLISSASDQKVNTRPTQELLESEFPEPQITVRQVGPRDVAKIYGGIGACGQPERCCSQFLTHFSSISIKMAKTQEISLTPEEITGMCGRLRCCLMYEYEQYKEGRLGLPKKNKWVETPEGIGRVSVVLPLRSSVLVYIHDKGLKEFSADDVKITQRPVRPTEGQRTPRNSNSKTPKNTTNSEKEKSTGSQGSNRRRSTNSRNPRRKNHRTYPPKKNNNRSNPKNQPDSTNNTDSSQQTNTN